MAAHDEYMSFWQIALDSYNEAYAHVPPAKPGEVAPIGFRMPNGKTVEDYPGELAHIRETMQGLVAQDNAVFYFDETAMGELGSEDYNRELLDTAAEFYREGILAAPFPRCLFLFKRKGNTFLAHMQEIENGFRVTSFLNENPIQPGNDYSILPALSVDFRRQDCGKFTEGLFTTELEGRAMFAPENVPPSRLKLILAESLLLFLGGCMLLNMPYFDKQRVDIPEALAKARYKRGKPALRAYTTVKLRKDIADAMTDGQGGWKVRPHYRRGHIRRLSDGRAIPVMPCMVNFEGDDAALKKNTYVVK